jgi:hypothetical protein
MNGESDFCPRQVDNTITRQDFELLGEGWQVRNQLVHEGLRFESLRSSTLADRLFRLAHGLLQRLEAGGAE